MRLCMCEAVYVYVDVDGCVYVCIYGRGYVCMRLNT